MPDGPLLLVVNPSAGGGRARKAVALVTAALDEARTPFRIEHSRSIEHASEVAAQAVDSGELPVAIGGDGMVAAVGNPLIGTQVPLGIIPAGRGNDLARGLGLPTDPIEAVDVVLEGKRRRIDAGEANGKRFLGIASVGFDSRANEIANRTTGLPGPTVYAWAAIRALVGWKPVRFSMEADGVRSRQTAHTIAIANNGFYGAGMNMAPEADLGDGLLDLIVIHDVSRLRFLAGFPKVFTGRHVDGEMVTSRMVTRVELKAAEPLTVFADGDPLTELPASFRVLPSSLSILVPGGQEP